MIRYLRLYAYFIRFSISRSLEFRVDFFFRFFMDSIYYVVQFMFFKVLFYNTSTLGGWREDQVFVFVAGYLMVDAIQMTLFSNNVWWFPTLVNRGDLDYLIVRPVSSLFIVSTRDFATNSLLNFLTTIGITVWALMQFKGELTAIKVGTFYILIFAGAFLHYIIHMLFMMPVFWTHSGRGLEQAFWPMTKFMERPDTIFTGVTRKALRTILPFSVMASLPAHAILGTNLLETTIHVIGITLLFFIFLVFTWRVALKTYSSASS